MLRCLRQLLTNVGLEGMSRGQAAPRRPPGAMLKELERAEGSRQAGQKAREISGPCMVAVPMGNEKVFGNSEYLGKAVLSACP